MKYAFALLVFMFLFLRGTACDSEGLLTTDYADDIDDDYSMKNTITIEVGEMIFTATLLDNASATAFKAMLPLTINMTELNGNEKYFRFSQNLPTKASNPGTINSGDLMLWGSNTLVLFYETFSTSYSYTKLGAIDNPTDLANALGSGDIVVTIELQ